MSCDLESRLKQQMDLHTRLTYTVLPIFPRFTLHTRPGSQSPQGCLSFLRDFLSLGFLLAGTSCVGGSSTSRGLLIR